MDLKFKENFTLSIAASSGMGKTSLVLHLLKNVKSDLNFEMRRAPVVHPSCTLRFCQQHNKQKQHKTHTQVFQCFFLHFGLNLVVHSDLHRC